MTAHPTSQPQTSMVLTVSVEDQAQALVTKLTKSLLSGHGVGSMSPSVYDTAWVSMLQYPAHHPKASEWAFPECFDFVLDTQLPSGAWESYASATDGILNTAAALLSMRLHLKASQSLESDIKDWLPRAQRAEDALRTMLRAWDVDSADQVGFEMLVMKHLGLLAAEGIALEFPQMGKLQLLCDLKLAKLPASSIFKAPSTLLHSLEALIGHIDFDQARQWREPNGSMMSSPSSTAAYLMHASVWDEQAEAYLRSVLHRGTGRMTRSVPSAWPTTIFETTWVVSTLSGVGLELPANESSAISEFLEKSLSQQHGVLGFSPGCFPDADDTAKAIITTSQLGRDFSAEQMVSMFEGSDHFKTYPSERNSSFTANCNVLICLLMQQDPKPDRCYFVQIAKATRFVTVQVFSGQVKDKWHLNELYWMMLLAQAYALLYQDEATAKTLTDMDQHLQEHIPIVSLHILTRILASQRENGSWEGICEVTSYSILALLYLSRLPWIQHLGPGLVADAMMQAQNYLQLNRSEWTKGHYLWIEKVTYASDLLSEAYCLAASMATPPQPVAHAASQSHDSKLFRVPERSLSTMTKFGRMLQRVPLFHNMKPSVLRVAEMQACWALLALQRDPPDVFPPSAKQAGGQSQKHMCMIPLAFMACAAAQQPRASVPSSVLWEMIVLSLLNFQVDEYMETVVETELGGKLDEVRVMIRNLFEERHELNGSRINSAQTTDSESMSEPDRQGYTTNRCYQNGSNPEDFQDHKINGFEGHAPQAHVALSRFVDRILTNPAVLCSPASHRTRLAQELKTFLLAHVTHAEDNHIFNRQRHRTQSQGIQHPSPSSNGHSVNGHGSNGTTSNGHNLVTNPDVTKLNSLLVEYVNPGRSFYAWVRSTSADHTSCPFSFVFYNMLVRASVTATDHVDVYGSARKAYLAEDLCRHLATMCRIYNDLGSVKRDADEGNVNSVNWPEFQIDAVGDGQKGEGKMVNGSGSSCEANHGHGGNGLDRVKRELFSIAEYERRGLDLALSMLKEELNGGFLGHALELFVNVTDLYGQVYVLEDIGIRTK